MTLPAKAYFVGAMLLGSLLGSYLPAKQVPTTSAGTSASLQQYYITAKVRLVTTDTVYLFGASNLPTGSVLIAYVYDYIGEGGTTVTEETRLTVGTDHLFRASIHPKAGLKFRTNMVCSIVFEPNYPSQPRSVLQVVGVAGERLGSIATNPQIEGNSRITGLAEETILTD